MLIIKIKIWRSRFITWYEKLYYIVFLLAILLNKWAANDIRVLFEYLKDDIKLVCTNGYKRHYYLILIGFMVD